MAAVETWCIATSGNYCLRASRKRKPERHSSSLNAVVMLRSPPAITSLCFHFFPSSGPTIQSVMMKCDAESVRYQQLDSGHSSFVRTFHSSVCVNTQTHTRARTHTYTCPLRRGFFLGVSRRKFKCVATPAYVRGNSALMLYSKKQLQTWAYVDNASRS